MCFNCIDCRQVTKVTIQIHASTVNITIITFKTEIIRRHSRGRATMGLAHQKHAAAIMGTMLKAIANLVPPNSMETRNQMASKIFERCANSGYVNDLVLKEFQRCVSRDCFIEVLGDRIRNDRHRKGLPGRGQPSIPLSSLPKEWRANVQETKARRNDRRKGKDKSNPRSSGTAGKRNQTNQRRQRRNTGRKKQENEEEEKDDGIFHTVPGFSIVETSWQSGKDL